MAIVLQYWFMVNFRKDYVTIPVAVGDRRAWGGYRLLVVAAGPEEEV
jgi:hypothetical protein